MTIVNSNINDQKEYRKTNLNTVDFARFICSLLVFIIHIPIFTNKIIASNTFFATINTVLIPITRIATPYFFIVSGFFVFRNVDVQNFQFKDIKRYLYRYIKLYIIWTLIYTPLIVAYIINRPEGAIMGSLLWLKDFLISGSYYQLWYLNALIFAIAITGILLSLKLSVKKICILALLFYFIGLFGCSYAHLLNPLQDIAPFIWQGLHLIKNIIFSTRNGLFFGFPFVAIGVLFANYHFKLEFKKTVIAFVVCLFLLLLENIMLRELSLSIMFDNMIMLIPTTSLLFYITLNTNMKGINTKKIRSLSSLIFFTHTFIMFFVGKIIVMFNITTHIVDAKFIISLILTIVCSLLIHSLSNKYKILKNLY